MAPHRRKGGALDIDKKTIVVRYEGREHTVSWFSGASDEAISRTIDNALGLPRGAPAVIRDPEDGSALTISDSIPDGLTLDAKPAATAGLTGENGNGAATGGGGASKWRESGNAAVSQNPLPAQRPEEVFYGSNENGKPINAGSGMGGTGGGGGGGNSIGSSGSGGGGAKEFRGELLKFERVNAHLANERTWLAWVRTALSVLGVALSLLSLADDMGSLSMDSIALALGVAFVLCTLFTYLTGWLRYTRVKEVLTWTGSQVKGTFGRFGLQYFSWFLGIALLCTVPLYLIGGVNVVEGA